MMKKTKGRSTPLNRKLLGQIRRRLRRVISKSEDACLEGHPEIQSMKLSEAVDEELKFMAFIKGILESNDSDMEKRVNSKPAQPNLAIP